MNFLRLVTKPAFIALVAAALTGCATLKSGRSPSDLALAEENYHLKSAREKLQRELADAKAAKAATVPAAGNLKPQLDAAEEKLSQALRSYTQAQEESAQLQAAIAQARAENTALTAQVTELAAAAQAGLSPAQAPASASPAASADAESNLATALRSYALLREENDRVKTDLDRITSEKATSEAQVSSLQAAVPVAAQAQTLREQLRQVQGQMAVYAEENVRLRTQLALNGPAPGAGPAQSQVMVTPTAVASTPDPVTTPTPVADPAGKVHTIGAGDTLSRIAQAYYGSASRWPEILAANRDTLKNENSLVAGKKIRIP